MDLAVILLSFGSAFCFALALVITQFGLRTIGPLSGAGISVPTTAALFLALSPFTADLSQWHAGGAALFAAAGLVFPAVVTLLTFASNRHIGPSLTGALGNLSPLFAVGIAVILLGETPRAVQLVGVATVCLGVMLLVTDRWRATPETALLVLGLPLLAALLRGLTQPVVKLGLGDWPSPFAAVTIGYSVSAIVVRLALGLTGAHPSRSRGSDRLWFVGVGLCNGAAVLLLYTALARGPVSTVAPLVACHPLITLVLNRMMHPGGPLGAVAATGVALTVAGIAALLTA